MAVKYDVERVIKFILNQSNVDHNFATEDNPRQPIVIAANNGYHKTLALFAEKEIDLLR